MRGPGPQSCLWLQLPHFLLDRPVASLPWAVAPRIQGLRGLGRGEGGAVGSSGGSPRVFPTSGRKGRKELGGEEEAVQQMRDRSGLPGQEPTGLPLLCSTHGLSHPGGPWPPQALCCTYSRLVFIPCEDDILFLLSVSVFMCEELLACCACARGELVPGDWTA